VISAKQQTATTTRYYNLHSFTNATLYKYVVFRAQRNIKRNAFQICDVVALNGGVQSE